MVCISCGEYATIDLNGQCYNCHKNGRTTDRWGKPIEWLKELNKSILKKVEGEINDK